jgi:hypothetical protein
VSSWLSGSGYTATTISAADGHVEVDLAGTGIAPSMANLVAGLRSQGANATVTVNIFPEQTLNGATTP